MKSQPNVLKRTGRATGPADGLCAVDFRAGLALLPFLPMSPGDFKLIFKGLSRGSLVQFDRGNLAKLEAFVIGASNLFRSFGIPPLVGKSMIAVFIVSFANTTLDSAARIQRLSLQEIFHNKQGTIRKPLDNRYQVMRHLLTANTITIQCGTRVSQRHQREVYDDARAFVDWIKPLFAAANQQLNLF